MCMYRCACLLQVRAGVCRDSGGGCVGVPQRRAVGRYDLLQFIDDVPVRENERGTGERERARRTIHRPPVESYPLIT